MIDSEAINVFLASKVETHILTVDLLLVIIEKTAGGYS